MSYGLGSPNRDLPDFVVLVSRMQRPSDQPLYDYYWGSGFLPGRYQGARFRNASEPVLYLQDPAGLPAEVTRGALGGLAELNALHQARTGDPETLARVRQHELAYRMQSSVPELTCTAPTAAGREATRPTACWRADWRSVAFVSSSCSIPIGIITAGCRRGAWPAAATPTRPPPGC